jgi:hypothetical protein
MSRAAKRKVQRTHGMTTEQLAQKLLTDVQEMSEQEKAKLRDLLDKELRVPRFQNLGGYADAARKCAAEEAAMLNYDGKGSQLIKASL